MISNGKPPFDPKVFLAKVDGGRAISIIGRIKLSTGRVKPRILFSTFRAGQVKATVVSEQGEGSRGRTSRNRRFLWRRVFGRTATASVNCLRNDAVRDRANSKGRHHPRHPRRASICRVIYSHLLARNSRVEEDLVDLLFDSSRETAGTHPSASGEFRQRRSAGSNYSENQPRDTGGDDRHDAISCEPFHEQISGIGPY